MGTWQARIAVRSSLIRDPEERERRFEEWWDEVHERSVLSVGGVARMYGSAGLVCDEVDGFGPCRC